MTFRGIVIAIGALTCYHGTRNASPNDCIGVNALIGHLRYISPLTAIPIYCQAGPPGYRMGEAAGSRHYSSGGEGSSGAPVGTIYEDAFGSPVTIFSRVLG